MVFPWIPRRAGTIVLLPRIMNRARGELLTLVSALQDHQYNVFVFDFRRAWGQRGRDDIRVSRGG